MVLSGTSPGRDKNASSVAQLQAALEGKDESAGKAVASHQPQTKFKNFEWKFRVIAPVSNYSASGGNQLDWENQTFCVSALFIF